MDLNYKYLLLCLLGIDRNEAQRFSSVNLWAATFPASSSHEKAISSFRPALNPIQLRRQHHRRIRFAAFLLAMRDQLR